MGVTNNPSARGAISSALGLNSANFVLVQTDVMNIRTTITPPKKTNVRK